MSCEHLINDVSHDWGFQSESQGFRPFYIKNIDFSEI